MFLIRVLPGLANILVLSLWTALNPLEWTRDIASYNEFDQPTESIGSCWDQGDENSSNVIYLATLGGLNISILLLAMHQAYKARHIHLEFAESEYISKALSTSLLVCFVGIPVMFLVNNDNATSFFVLSRYVGIF